eukprot:1189927-Prorocentrum_minimum.AAC.2
MCVLLWRGESFQPKWVEKNAFLWKDYKDPEEPGEEKPDPVIPEKDNVIRLMLWMVYEYGQDVINAPFHIDKTGSHYEGETLLHMAVARRDLGTIFAPSEASRDSARPILFHRFRI